MTEFTYFSCNPKVNTIELPSFILRLVFSCWTCWRCSWQRPSWGYPGGSSPVPPPSSSHWLGSWSRPDVTARQVLKCLDLSTDLEQNPNHYDTTHTYLFHVQTQTQSWLTKTHFTPLFSPPLPHSKKASIDLTQCLKWKTAERVIKRRGSLCGKWELSHLAVAERWCMISASLDKKVSPPVVSSLQLSWHWNAARLSDFKPKYLSKGSYQATSVSCM